MPETIDETNYTDEKQYSSIDFQTILKSENIKKKILIECFGIHNETVKEYITELTTNIQFQTIFISYSFHDKKITNLINNALRKKGVITFLWEKDAPGGRGLKRIMRENINKHDRLLFVASKNSLQSEACHYELFEGRKKQEDTWDDILYPIHIDDYLLTVKKEEIGSGTKYDKFWENICELKRMNSIDFSEYNTGVIDNTQFDESIAKLINSLRKVDSKY